MNKLLIAIFLTFGLAALAQERGTGGGGSSVAGAPLYTNSGQLYFDATNGNNANSGVVPWLPLQTFDSAGTLAYAGQSVNLVSGNVYTFGSHHPSNVFSNTVVNAWGATVLLNQASGNAANKLEATNIINGGNFIDVHTSGSIEQFLLYLANDVPSLTTLNSFSAFGKIDVIVFDYVSTSNPHNLTMNGGSLGGFWDTVANVNSTGASLTGFTNYHYFTGVNFTNTVDGVTYNLSPIGGEGYHCQGVNTRVYFAGCNFNISGNATNWGNYAIALDGKDAVNGNQYSVVGYVSGCTFNVTNTLNGSPNGPALWFRLTNGAVLHWQGPPPPTNCYEIDATSTLIVESGNIIIPTTPDGGTFTNNYGRDGTLTVGIAGTVAAVSGLWSYMAVPGGVISATTPQFSFTTASTTGPNTLTNTFSFPVTNGETVVLTNKCTGAGNTAALKFLQFK